MPDYVDAFDKTQEDVAAASNYLSENESVVGHDNKSTADRERSTAVSRHTEAGEVADSAADSSGVTMN